MDSNETIPLTKNECENCIQGANRDLFYETPELTKERHEINKDLKATSKKENKFIRSNSLNLEDEQNYIIFVDNGNEVIKLDREKYVEYYDKNGKRFATLKKYEDIIDFSSIDVNESRHDITKLIEESSNNNVKTFNSTNEIYVSNQQLQIMKTEKQEELQLHDPEITPLASCYDGTGPVGDCEITKYKNERYIKSRVFVEERSGVSIYCILDLCIPIVGKVDYCYVTYDTYTTPYYRCWLHNWCNTMNYWGTREKTNTTQFASTTLPCSELPEANTWQTY